MDKERYKKLLERSSRLNKTSSILSVENNSLTFARNEKYLKNLLNTDKKVDVIIPHNMDTSLINQLQNNIFVHTLDAEDNIEYIFTYIHNEINKYNDPKPNIISLSAKIHPTAIVGVHGNTYCVCPDGSKMNLKHMGNVVIEDDVDVEALSIIHRAGMASTTLKKGAKICVKVNVGHNCYIGENTFVAPGVLLGGGAVVGKDCYIWQGVITRSNITICDKVIIGAGSLVLCDINVPGIYYGSPVKYVKDYEPSLR